MKQFSMSANNSFGASLGSGRLNRGRRAHRRGKWRVASAAAAVTCVAASLMAFTAPAYAQVSPRNDFRNNGLSARDNAIQRQESFQDRMRRGNEAARQRAYDTDERVRRDAERQKDQVENLRRQR
jgi:hypothetical protein